MNRVLACSFLAAASLLAQRSANQPLGLVTEPGQAHLVRAGTQLDISLRKGDLLFDGDRVTVESASATLWFCPAARVVRLESQAEVRIEAARVALVSGRIANSEPSPFCPVPEVNRETLAKPAFFGREISRDAIRPQPTAEDAVLTPSVRTAMETELRRIEQSAVPDPALRIAARAAVYAKYGLHHSSAESFDSLAGSWPAIDWPRQLVHQEHELSRGGTTSSAAIGGTGKTYALLIGISDYPRLAEDQRLRFADGDADLMYAYLRSQRGGALPAENIRLLRNRQATASAIRNSIADFLRARATRDDTVILFMSAHGISGNDGAYIIASDSDPDNLRDTGIDMLEIQELLEGGLKEVGHVLIFVDVCHAGLIGNIHNRNFSRVLQILGRFKGEETYGLLASAPDETSVESERFGGGHGAFSYFLSRALNGDADEDGDGHVTVNELQAYVYNMVRHSTRNRQNPRPTGDMPGERVLISDLTKAGIEIKGWDQPETLAQQQVRGTPNPGPQPPLPYFDVTGNPEIRRFEQALAADRLLPPESDNALTLLLQLRPAMSRNPLQRLLLENALRIALQNHGQEVLLKYLRGEEIPQRQEDFEQGARWFEGTLSLDPEALAWQSRAWFCAARAMLFQNRFPEAQELLERAIRIEPEGPYLYNALGLLYLQQASYSRAAAAFRDAIRLAPYWSYPRHNLALALVQTGEYNPAIAVYRDAQRVAPSAWFIPYNLGLVQEKVENLREAEKMFRMAAALAPGRPEPVTALGYLAALRGRSADAERYYRQALNKQASFAPARHNLALLLSQTNRTNEAVSLWGDVLQQDPGYVASRLALAATLENAGRNQEALDQYREAFRTDPGMNAARLASARLLIATGRPAESEQGLRAMLTSQPQSAAAWDLLGDAMVAQTRPQEAAEAYRRAESLSSGEQRRSIGRKLKKIRS